MPLPFRQTTRYHPKAQHQHYGHEYPQIQRHVGGLVVAPRERLPPMTLNRCAASLGAAHLAAPSGSGTASYPWHAPFVQPATGQAASAVRGCSPESGATANPTPTAPTRTAPTTAAASSLFLADLCPRDRLASFELKFTAYPFLFLSFPTKEPQAAGPAALRRESYLVPEQPIRRPSP